MLLLFPQDTENQTDVASPLESKGDARKRRGVTAMEYLVMLSFILLAVILAVQHIGNLTGKSLTDSAQKTHFKNGE